MMREVKVIQSIIETLFFNQTEDVLSFFHNVFAVFGEMGDPSWLRFFFLSGEKQKAIKYLRYTTRDGTLLIIAGMVPFSIRNHVTVVSFVCVSVGKVFYFFAQIWFISVPIL